MSAFRDSDSKGDDSSEARGTSNDRRQESIRSGVGRLGASMFRVASGGSGGAPRSQNPREMPMHAADQGKYGTCALHAFTDVVQEQVQLRYGVTLDVRHARAILEGKLRMDLGEGATARKVACAINDDEFYFKPWSHDGFWVGVKVVTMDSMRYEDLVKHVKANVGDSCA